MGRRMRLRRRNDEENWKRRRRHGEENWGKMKAMKSTRRRIRRREERIRRNESGMK